MPVERFLDTNILIYGYDPDAPEKREIARGWIVQAWLNAGRLAIGVQQSHEFRANFVRKGGGTEDSAALIADLALGPVIDNALAVFRRGLSLQKRWELSLWDAMIVAA